jgi:hypothetical protein
MSDLVVIIAWLSIATITSVVASRKGHRGDNWFAAGFFGSVFALAYAIAMSPNLAGIERKALRSGTMKKCPWCAELVRCEAITCRSCGRDLPKP